MGFSSDRVDIPSPYSAPASEMTYTVSGGALNSTQYNHTRLHIGLLSAPLFLRLQRSTWLSKLKSWIQLRRRRRKTGTGRSVWMQSFVTAFETSASHDIANSSGRHLTEAEGEGFVERRRRRRLMRQFSQQFAIVFAASCLRPISAGL